MQCDYCNGFYNSKTILKIHFQVCKCYPGRLESSGLKCQNCDKSFFTRGQLKTHLVNNKCGADPEICNLCNCSFQSKKSLNRHYMFHANLKVDGAEVEKIYDKKIDGKYICTICNIIIESRDRLYVIAHYITDHNAKLECKACAKLFEKQRHLYKHITKRHAPGATDQSVSLNCRYCGKHFRTRYHLREHEPTHTNERAHLCKICGLGFNTSSTLKSHEKRHVEVKPFMCEICCKRYYTSSRLKSHMRVHTGKSFTYLLQFLEITLCISGERPYSCTECGKGYTTGYALKTHAMKHKGML